MVKTTGARNYNPHEVKIDLNDYDHVDEDEIIPDQQFGLISFYEPKDDTLTLRELYIFEQFIKECLREDPELDKKRVNFKKISSKKLIELYHDFRYDNMTELTAGAKEKYPDQIFERAFKIRGNYKSQKKAQDRMNYLKKSDQLHSQYIVQVGKWAPFNPPEHAIAEYETSNKKLNEMMQSQRKNVQDAKEFYETQKQERIQQTMKLNEERRKKLENNDEAAILAEKREQEILGIFDDPAPRKVKPSKANRIDQTATPEDAGISGTVVDPKNYKGIKIKDSEREHKTLSDFAGDGETAAMYANSTMGGDMNALNRAKTAVKNAKLNMDDFDDADFDNVLLDNLSKSVARSRS